MIADYFFIHKQNLNLKDLYLRNGEYEFTSGINWKAILSLVAGIVVALIGVFVSELRFLYDYAWFVGFGVAAICYMVVMRK